MVLYGKGIEFLDTIDNSFKNIMTDSRYMYDERHCERLGADGNIFQNCPIIFGGLRKEKMPSKYPSNRKVHSIEQGQAVDSSEEDDDMEESWRSLFHQESLIFYVPRKSHN